MMMGAEMMDSAIRADGFQSARLVGFKNYNLLIYNKLNSESFCGRFLQGDGLHIASNVPDCESDP